MPGDRQSTQCSRLESLVLFGRSIGRGRGSGRLRYHTSVRTGTYTAVREVTLTRIDQGRETERFEVGIGESYREGFAPGNMPWSKAATGHVAQFPRDSQLEECCSTTSWCFPLAPKSGRQSQSDPRVRAINTSGV